MPIKIDRKIVNASVVKPNDKPKEEPKTPIKALKRPRVLEGKTYKLTNNAKGYNLYITVNKHENKPFELFIDGSHTDATEWVKALSRLISAMLRTEHFSLEFVAKELMKIHSDQGYHTGGKGGFVAGVVQHIGKTLLEIHKEDLKTDTPAKVAKTAKKEEPDNPAMDYLPDPCPECGDTTMVLRDGCPTCLCGYSKCG